jgi:hypothetical protein
MRILKRDFKLVIITTEEVKNRLIPDLQNFNISNMTFANSKSLKDGNFTDCVEINLISAQRVLNEIIKYLEDSYPGNSGIFYYYHEADYY